MHPYPFRELESLTWPEILRATRWPGAFGVAVGYCLGEALHAAGVYPWLVFVLTLSAAFSATCWLSLPAVQRARWRKWHSLEA